MFSVRQPLLLPSSNFQEPFYDSSCSELSDIPEVEEPSSPDSTNENRPLKDTLKSLVNGLSNMSNDSSDFEEIYQRNLTQVRVGNVYLRVCVVVGPVFTPLQVCKA